ncbi:MAG: insulinase family protein [Spirochaetes bacterium]|nr:insulinase family protein [Spirochaetota bacterium]
MKSIFQTKKHFVVISGAALLVAILIACAGAPRADFGGLGRANDPVPLTSAAITGTLPNGLRYFILENSRPENRAHLALVVNAGSVVERDYERGMAHFVEHMAFRGTERFPEGEIIDFLRSLGMRFGPDVNAFVSFNETVYHFEVPVETVDGIRRVPDKALAILDEWSHSVSFNPEYVDLERLVILEEYRGRLSARERVSRQVLPVLFAGSQYAERHPIGTWEIIETTTADQLRAFYERWYTADNMALVFVGDFDGRALQASLVEHFHIAAPETPANRPQFSLPPPRRGSFQVEFITDPELTSANFELYFRQRPGPQRGTVGHFRDTVIDSLISTMLALRFEEDLTNPQASAVASWGGMWRWSQNARFYAMGTEPVAGRAEEALWDLLLAKESMRRHGFNEDELDRAKTRMLASLDQRLAERDNQQSAQLFHGFRNHFILGQAMPGIEWEAYAVPRLLDGIGTRDIAAAVRNYFSARDTILFAIAPEAEAADLPSYERISAMFREAARANVAPRVSVTLTGDLLDAPPAPGVIANETVDAATGAVIWTLGNNATVILKETQNMSNEIILYAGAAGGTAGVGQSASVSARLAAEMLAVSGLGDFSRTDLLNILTGRQVSMAFWATHYQRGFRGSSATQDVRTLFEMLHLGFTNPRLDEAAIGAMLNQHRNVLARQGEDPQGTFNREITRTINGGHFHFSPLELADMDAVSVEQARGFLENHLNPGDFTFVFTGNIDLDEMRGLVATYIASIPNSHSVSAWTDPGIVRPGQVQREIRIGLEERSMVYLGWFAPATAVFSEQRNQVSAVLNEYLNIVLMDEIRERLGGVYSIGAGASVATVPTGEYRLQVFFNCDPARAMELIAAVKAVLDQVANQPLDMAVFDQATEALLMGHERSMQANLHIAQSFVNSAAFFNTPLSRLTERPQAIRNVSPQDVQVMARSVLSAPPVQIVLFPEGWQN